MARSAEFAAVLRNALKRAPRHEGRTPASSGRLLLWPSHVSILGYAPQQHPTAAEHPMTLLRLLVGMLGLLVTTMVDAQTADPRVADLVRSGKVRFGMFPPQYTKDAK